MPRSRLRPFGRGSGEASTQAVSAPAGPTVPRPVRIVTATQLSTRLFWRASYLGRSLNAIPDALRPEVTVFAENTGPAVRGLPELYNEALDAADPDDILVLVHDDVYLHDWFVTARAREAMAEFGLAGIAGAVDPDLAQPSWIFAFGEDFTQPRKQPGVTRSGAINHFDHTSPSVQIFGDTPHECLLLDGVLLILDAGRAQATGTRFDDRFHFHFYDLDVCRTAHAAGMRIGTWPIAVTHDSIGGFDSETFRQAAKAYLAKWEAANQQARGASPSP